jgi:hypothetical protein
MSRGKYLRTNYSILQKFVSLAYYTWTSQLHRVTYAVQKAIPSLR